MLSNALLVGAGGALGSLGRYLLGLACARWLGDGFPYGTLLVNVAGCAAIGLLGAGILPTDRDHPARLFLIVGLLGGLTTFSAFGAETVELWRSGRGDLAALNAGLNLVVGFIAVALGAWCARAMNVT